MNNRYICEAKRKDNNEWIEGYLVKYNERYYIYYEYADEMCQTGNYLSYKEVIPETVRQCTGLKDKNGKLIFEGDIVKDTQSGICYFIKWFSECACYSLANKDGEMNFGCDELEIFLDDLEVIGNIHDDKNLLEVER